MLSANLGGRLAAASTASSEVVDAGLARLSWDLSGLLEAGPVSVEVLWAVGGLGALAFAFLATRMADQL